VAKIQNLEIGVEVKVDRATAEMCLRIIELYLIQNEDETIRINRDKDSVRAVISKRKCEKTPDGMGGIITKYLE
jgi:hypothetical protein